MAGVAAGAGVVFGLQSRGTLSDIDDELETGTPPLDTSDPRFDDGRREARNANISFAVAGAAVLTGAVLTWIALRPAAAGDTIVVPTSPIRSKAEMVDARPSFASYVERISARPASQKAQARNQAAIEERGLRR